MHLVALSHKMKENKMTSIISFLSKGLCCGCWKFSLIRTGLAGCYLTLLELLSHKDHLHKCATLDTTAERSTEKENKIL